ncbi:MAG TPA: hypothetical protein VHE30_16835 [Polyangiaceae bacterium]|nr:hypothetical protein [Polyangiaceae bacterium]
MRTTLTLDPDVQALLDGEVRRTQKTFKAVVNDALRRGLTRAPGRGRPVVLRVFDSRLRPGYDARSLNALADELEDEAVLVKARR